ncbi:MAG: TrmB family transcriptional regulator, partial [Nitrosopumilaceae archaeon]|nr:TrmB family transcriptional regulator [Nitrosopumilaceae archaeon]
MVISLEEFGLSKYESNAYLTLISKGATSASDLAYYSAIPRTKIYSVLLKLAKKRLVILSRSKPITCTAIGPENAFNSILQKQINKVDTMNTIIDNLKEINLNSKHNTVDEKIYHHINVDNNFTKINQLFDNVKSSIKIMVDCDGMNILTKCKKQLIISIKKDILIQIIVPPNAIATNQFKTIPDGIKIHISDISQNCFIFDDSELLLIDNKVKTSAIFHYDIILNNLMLKIFLNVWNNSYDANHFDDIAQYQAQEIYK